jgi:Ca2+-transporting ATPase
MVTGDNILTASKIARECGIMYGSGVALEGPVFRAMSKEEKIAALPKLQVLARSSPTDKHTLVSLLRELGEVVAVTGDGTNDAPAMKEADVGFAMGISGTQIAMNASDIILLDDNFVSIVQSIRWGRNVLNSVRKFLQFQLGVNLVAIIITFIGSVANGVSPLNTIQLLWVNLIMDSLGALALATDEPDDDVLEHPPHSRFEPLLSVPMKEYILSQMIYQLIALLGIFFGIDTFLPSSHLDHEWRTKRINTMMFTTFIYLQCMNEIMARQLNGELTIFRNFFRNKTFIILLIIILLIQTITVAFGEAFLGTVPMTSQEWLVCVIVSLIDLPFVFIYRAAFLLYHRYHPIETHGRKEDPALDGMEADLNLSKKRESVSAPAKVVKTSEDETHLIDHPPRETREMKQVTDIVSEDAEPPAPVQHLEKSPSLVELIHPFRKDSSSIPLKNSRGSLNSLDRRSSLSLKKSLDILM